MAAAGGLAGGLAFDPFSMRALIPLAPLGLFLAMRGSASPRGAAWRVFAGAYVFYFLTVCWLFTVSRFFIVTALGIPFVPFYIALFPAAAAWIVKRWFERAGVTLQFALFGALWLLGEWTRTLGEASFPWAMLGHALAPWPWAIQGAEWLGELGVSLWALLAAGALLAGLGWFAGRGANTSKWWRSVFDESPPGSFLPALLLLALCGLMLAGSAARLRQWDARLEAIGPEGRLRVAAIQPGIDQFEKIDSYAHPDEARRETLQRAHFRQLAAIVRDRTPEGTDLIVLPESAFAAFNFALDPVKQQLVGELFRDTGAAALFGASYLRFENDPPFAPGVAPEIAELYNSAWFVPAGEGIDPARRQDKMRLVPFGEHIPFVGSLPFVRILLPFPFDAGARINLFSVAGHRFGAMVCFESAYATQSRRITREGANFLTLITNDAWYGNSAGPGQHHHMARLRAVENRRPLVRSANTGISSIIDPAGRITASLPVGAVGAVVGTIAPQTVETFFTRWGNTWLVLACLTFVTVTYFLLRRKPDPKQVPG